MTPSIELRPRTTRSTSADRVAAAAMAFGAITFAVSGLVADEPLGTTLSSVMSGAVVVAALLMLVGIMQLLPVRRAALGRTARWGGGLVVAGLVATAMGSVLNVVVPLMQESAQAAFALAGIPAWSLSHLIYVGATVLGIACLRRPVVPRPLAILLVASLPLLLLGVALGLALPEPASHVVTWAATEGQAGVAWLLIAVHHARRPVDPGAAS